MTIRNNNLLPLAFLCGVAVTLRLAVRARYPGFVHPDEIFQYLEPAHRLVYGTGIIPWEFKIGLRNWVIPGALAAVIEFSRAFGETPRVQSWAVATAMSMLSLVPVVCGFLWGRRVAGLPGAWIAAVLGAVWFEAVYYAPHPLADTVAAALLAGTLWIGDPQSSALTRRRMIWAGLAFGMTAVVRIQLTPGLAIAMLALCRRQFRARWLPVLAGGAVSVLLLGLLDRLTWGTWFHSLRMTFWANQIKDIASIYGVEPWNAYLGWLLFDWLWATPLVLGAALAGARSLPVLGAVCVVTLVSFSFIPHKEARFIYPIVPLILTLAAVGTTRILAPLLARPNLRAGTVFVALACWSLVSFGLALRTPFLGQLQIGTGMLRLMDDIATDPTACGLALLPIGDDWSGGGGWTIGGYSHLRQDMSLFQALPAESAAQADAYNAILTLPGETLHDPRYTKVTCLPNGPLTTLAHDVCLWRRPGSCDPSGADPMVAPHEFVIDLLR